MTGLAARLTPPSTIAYPGEHLGLRWRPMMPADGPAVYDLVRRIEITDRSSMATTPPEVADLMEGSHGVDLVDSVVGIDAEGTIAAVASVRVLTRVTEMAVALVKAHIDPHWRGRGVGRALLYWQEARARQMLVEHFGPDAEVPAAISNVIDAHMTDRRRLSIAAGFYARRTFALMYREVQGGEEAPEPRGGYRIVPWDDVPRDQIRAVHLEVFRDHFWPEMRGQWWEDTMGELDPRWSFAAVAPDGQVAGYAACARNAGHWVSTGTTEAYIDLVGVGRNHRGKGLTTPLLGAVIAAAARSGIARVGLDVDTTGASGAHAIYEHLGFIDQGALVYYTIDH